MKIQKISDIKVTGLSILLFASPKQGKTTSMAYLPGKTLLIDCDKGTNVLRDMVNDNLDIVQLDEETTLFTILDFLETQKHEYNNVVIDSLSEVQETILSELGKKGKNQGIPELQHYQVCDYRIQDIVRRFRNLTSTGLNCIFTCWEEAADIVSSTGEKRSVIKPKIRKAESICGLMSMIGRLEISIKDGVTRYFRFQSVDNMYCGDRIFKRQFCKVNELLGEVKADEK